MELVLYKNFKKEVNSTKRPSGGTTVEVYLKDDTSILNPSFMIDTVDLDVNFCKWNNRYYFINNIILNNRHIYELQCSIDVMATWKTDILSSTQYVMRSASNYDGTIDDGMYPSRCFWEYKQTNDPTQTARSGRTYIIGVISGGTLTTAIGCTTYYALDALGINNLLTTLLANNDYMGISQDVLDVQLQKALINPLQYIVSCIAVPVPITRFGSGQTPVQVGWWSIPITNGTCVNASLFQVEGGVNTLDFTLTLPEHPFAEDRGSYLNFNQWSKHTLYFEPYGIIPLDNSQMVQSQIRIQEWVDLITGASILRVLSSSQIGSKLIAYASAQLGVNIQLAQMAIDNNLQQKIAIQTNASYANGFLSTLGTALKGNVLGAAQGAISMGASVATGVLDAERASFPRMEKSGMNGSFMSLGDVPTIYTTFSYPVDDDNTHLGRPLCRDVVLNTLSGYCLTRDAEIKVAGLKQENEMIKSIMNGGFYIE